MRPRERLLLPPDQSPIFLLCSYLLQLGFKINSFNPSEKTFGKITFRVTLITTVLNSSITIKGNSTVFGTVKQLPSSKSISNRALILNALTDNRSVVSNLSAARDTKLMQALINSNDQDHSIDVMDAGTTMRFLTAYFSLTNQKKILTGTDRMKQRPVKLLVDALRLIGAEIRYLGEEGFPPIETLRFETQKADSIEIPGNVSSQYISALMMIAPTLPHGLIIQLKGET